MEREKNRVKLVYVARRKFISCLPILLKITMVMIDFPNSSENLTQYFNVELVCVLVFNLVSRTTHWYQKEISTRFNPLPKKVQ